MLAGAGFLVGGSPAVKDNFALVVLAIVAVSVLPVIVEVWNNRQALTACRYLHVPVCPCLTLTSVAVQAICSPEHARSSGGWHSVCAQLCVDHPCSQQAQTRSQPGLAAVIMQCA